jgi:uridine kinase
MASRPVVVPIDGRSGAGKTTLAGGLAKQIDATIISGDDFYVGGVALRSDPPEVLVNACIDWKAARRVIRDLIDTQHAKYRAFDWEKFDGSVLEYETVLHLRGIVVLEGVYSARPELRDVVDVAVLVHLRETERMNRLLTREQKISDWEKQWHRAAISSAS